MIQAVAPARTKHGDIVDALGDVRQPIGDPQSALAVPLPFARGGEHRRFELSHGRDHAFESRRQRLAGELIDHRLVVESIDMARPAFREQEDHALGPRGEMRQLWHMRRAARGSSERIITKDRIGLQQLRKSQRSEATPAAQQHLAPGEGRGNVW